MKTMTLLFCVAAAYIAIYDRNIIFGAFSIIYFGLYMEMRADDR
jgi:hypothetical protein